ncbi:MAG: PBP1A family penicillin-binding protein [Spirochaetaceae bacterium]|nr:MAG: PBP1A family penicillin-binding protein [Spirochaetaceae bacterium]
MSTISSRRRRLHLLSLTVIAAAAVMGTGLAYALSVMSAAPRVEREYEALETTVVYARGGEVLAGIYQEDRIWTPLEDIPQIVRDAFIAVEDRNFYSHPGVDPWAMLRALYANLRHRRIVEGGSTITQQLARNLYLDRSRTVRRKLQEVRIALVLEERYTKDEILEMYLNHIYLGSGAYGVQAAAGRYFDTELSALSVDQAALLAALPRAPNYYSPFNNLEAAEGRRNLVLQRMSQNNYLTEIQATAAASRPLEVSDPVADRRTGASYFVEHVRRELLNHFEADMIYGDGLVIHTTLDVDTQSSARKVLDHAEAVGQIPTRARTDGAGSDPVDALQPQYALVTLDARSGAIRSMVGGRGGDEYNRAVQARRHPGSAFKPFIYAAAVTQGRHPGTVVNDIPRIDKYDEDDAIVWPRNFDDRYRGLVTYRRAMERSINTAAVQVLRELGLQTVSEHIDQYGFSSLTARDGRDDHYALALGGLDRGVSPLEMAAAYGTFAAAGTPPRPFAIKRVTDRHGRLLYRAAPTEDPCPEELYRQYLRYGLIPPYTRAPERSAVLTDAEAYIMTDMLRSVVEDGTGTAAALDVPAAGKTGTSDHNHDAWFVGYADGLVSAVWIGEDSPRPMRYRRTAESNNPDIELTGVHASIVWGDYMRRIIGNRNGGDTVDATFVKPDSVTTREIDPFTGQAPHEHSPRVITEIAVDETPRRVPWAYAVPMPTWSGLVEQLGLNHEADDDERPRFWSQIKTLEVDTLSGLPLLPGGFHELPDVEYTPQLTATRHYLRDCGTLLGPARFTLGGPETLRTADGNRFSGTYLADPWEPVQQIDPDTGLPVDSERPVFQRIFPILAPDPPAAPDNRSSTPSG